MVILHKTNQHTDHMAPSLQNSGGWVKFYTSKYPYMYSISEYIEYMWYLIGCTDGSNILDNHHQFTSFSKSFKWINVCLYNTTRRPVHHTHSIHTLLHNNDIIVILCSDNFEVISCKGDNYERSSVSIGLESNMSCWHWESSVGDWMKLAKCVEHVLWTFSFFHSHLNRHNI